MRFLEYLFFKYYNWAIRVGDGEIPSFTSVSIIAFFIMLYIVDINMTYSFFISQQKTLVIGKYFFGLFGISIMAILYIVLVTKGKDKTIMEIHNEEWTGKKNLWAVLFPTIAIVWFIISLFIKAIMNSGII